MEVAEAAQLNQAERFILKKAFFEVLFDFIDQFFKIIHPVFICLVKAVDNHNPEATIRSFRDDGQDPITRSGIQTGIHNITI